MKLKKTHNFSLDKFIDLSLYNNKFGYYMKKDPFGKKGDFITAPNISRLFSEMIAIWIISFWKSLGSPKKFNLIELGAGNGEMMKVLIESFQNFPVFLSSCNFIIHEKSPLLIKLQKKKLSKTKIKWVSKINEIKKIPSIFIANEFFDSIAIKQFIKKEKLWFEKFVNFKDPNNAFFFEKKVDIKKYLETIKKLIKKNRGGLLLIDYGYTEKKMKNTLKAVSNHKFANILDDIGNVDITHNINFNLLKEFTNKLKGLDNNLTTQKEFLLKIGIKQRAEILSKNKSFLEKADIFYRLDRLINEKQMGSLFKVMMLKNKENKFKLGF